MKVNRGYYEVVNIGHFNTGFRFSKRSQMHSKQGVTKEYSDETMDSYKLL